MAFSDETVKLSSSQKRRMRRFRNVKKTKQIEQNLVAEQSSSNFEDSKVIIGHNCVFLETRFSSLTCVWVQSCNGKVSHDIIVGLGEPDVKAVSVYQTRIFFATETDIFVIETETNCKTLIYSGDFSGNVNFCYTTDDFIVVSNNDTVSCIAKVDDCFQVSSVMSLSPPLGRSRSYIYCRNMSLVGIVWVGENPHTGKPKTFIHFHDVITTELVSTMCFSGSQTIKISEGKDYVSLLDGSKYEIPLE